MGRVLEEGQKKSKKGVAKPQKEIELIRQRLSRPGLPQPGTGAAQSPAHLANLPADRGPRPHPSGGRQDPGHSTTPCIGVDARAVRNLLDGAPAGLPHGARPGCRNHGKTNSKATRRAFGSRVKTRARNQPVQRTQVTGGRDFRLLFPSWLRCFLPQVRRGPRGCPCLRSRSPGKASGRLCTRNGEGPQQARGVPRSF